MKGRWVIAAAAVWFGVLAGRFYHPAYGWTRLLQFDRLDASARMPELQRLPIFVERNGGGYDGMYYAQIATAPSLRDPALLSAVDNLPYRARRILPSAAAWLIGGGRAGIVLQVYAVWNLLVWVGLAWLLGRWLPWNEWRGVAATLGILFSAGALSSVRFALTDLTAMGLLASALVARSQAGSAGAFAAACLSKETSILALPGLCWPFRRRRPSARAGAPAPRGWTALLGLLPLALWIEYVRRTIGPGDAGIDNFAPPVLGLLHKVQHIIAGIGQVDDIWIWATVLALAGLLVQSAYMLLTWRLDDAWWRVGIVQVGLMLVLGRAVWEGFPGAAFRALLPLTLAFNFYAHRRRAPWPLFLAGNLGVYAGVLTLWSVPTDPLEVGAGRSGRRAAVVFECAGWYGSEHTWRHAWAWAGPAGHELTFKTWGVPENEAVTVHCHLDARALSPRTLTIRQDGRVAWTGEISPAKSPIDFDVALEHATATLTCSTDRPPVQEAPDPGARALAFGLYDLKVTFPDARPASR